MTFESRVQSSFGLCCQQLGIKVGAQDVRPPRKAGTEHTSYLLADVLCGQERLAAVCTSVGLVSVARRNHCKFTCSGVPDTPLPSGRVPHAEEGSDQGGASDYGARGCSVAGTWIARAPDRNAAAALRTNPDVPASCSTISTLRLRRGCSYRTASVIWNGGSCR